MNQDVLNGDELRNFISKSVLTRTFEEIAGTDKYDVQQVMIEQGPEEMDIILPELL